MVPFLLKILNFTNSIEVHCFTICASVNKQIGIPNGKVS